MLTQTPKKPVTFKRTLTSVMLGVLSMATILYGGFAFNTGHAYAATNSTINFQARLQSSAGALVPDGYYNVEFKLYNATTGGTALWTEDYYDANGVTAGLDNRTQVINGYVSVNLGSQTAFPSNINWDQNLYLTMNVGGTTQTATPTYDGEMAPRLALTALPYAFKAGQLAQYNATSGFTSTLSLIQPTVGNQAFQVNDQGAAGTYTLCVQGATTANGGCASATGGTGYIQNQNASAQTSSNFWISGTGIAATALQAPSFDTPTAVALNIGTTNATSITVGKTGVNTFIGGNLSVGTTQSLGAITLANGSWISSVDASGSGTLNEFSANSNNQIQVGAALSVDGGVVLPTNGGQLTFSDLPIDASATAGTKESYSLRVGSTNALTVYGEADGSGNSQNVRVAIGSSIAPAYTLDVSGDINTTGAIRSATTTVISASGILQNASLSGTYGSLTGVGTLTAGTWNATAIGAAYGGTGQTTYTVGDLLYASGATALSKLSDVAVGSCLTSGGTATAPTWSSCAGGTAGSYIQNGTLVQATSNFNISGTGTAATSFVSPLIALTGTATASSILTGQVTGDTNPRFTIGADGKLNFGGGSGATDTVLFRSGAGVLQTNNSLNVASNLSVGGLSLGTGKLSVQSSNTGSITLALRQYAGQTVDILRISDINTNALSGIDQNGNLYTNGTSNVFTGLNFPAGIFLATAGTAGSTTYAYRITALNSQGETLPSAEVTIGTGNATLSGTNYVAVNFNRVSGASSYNIYGRTAGGELLLASVPAVGSSTYTYNDTGSATPSGALPTGAAFGAALTVSGAAGNSATNIASFKNYAASTSLSIDNAGSLNTNSSIAVTNTQSAAVTLALQNANASAASVATQVNKAGSTQTGDLLALQDSSGAALSGFTSAGVHYTNGVNTTYNALAVPAGLSSTVAGTSFYYKITALSSAGVETVASSEASSGAANTLTWTGVAGASSYRVYRGTSTGTEAGYYLLSGVAGTGTISLTTADTRTLTGASAPPIATIGSSLTLQGWTGQSTANLNSISSASSGLAFSSQVTGDAYSRFTIGADGSLRFGSGSAPTDISLLRAAAGSLVTSQNLSVGTAAVFNAKLSVQSASVNGQALVVRGFAGQSVDIFQVQDSSGNVNAAFNSVGSQLTLGKITSVSGATAGAIVFGDGTLDGFGGTLNTTTLTTARTYSLPNASGTICLTTTCASAAGSVTLQAGTPGTPDTGNINVSGTIIGGNLQGGTITATTGLVAPNVSLSAAAANTSVLSAQVTGDTNQRFAISAAGNLSFGSGSGVFDVTLSRTSSGLIGINNSLQVGSAIFSGNYFVTGAGKLNITPGATTGTGLVVRGNASQTGDLLQLQDSNNIVQTRFSSNGNLTLGTLAASGTVYQGKLILADGTADNFGGTINTTTLTAARTYTLPDASGTICLTTTCASSAGSVTLQAGTPGTADTGNINVSGTIIAGTGLKASSLDAASTGALSLGATTATSVAVGNTSGASSVALKAGTGGVSIASGGIGNTVQIGNTSGAVSQTINIGTNSTAASTNAIAIGSTVGSTVSLQSSTTQLQNSATGVVVQTSTNIGTAFQVQNSASAPIFLVDTTSTVNLLAYSGFETGNPPTGWSANGAATISQNSNKANTYHGLYSLQLVTSGANQGTNSSAFTQTVASGTYVLSFYARLGSGTMAGNLFAITSTDGTTHTCNPTAAPGLTATGFTRVSCSFTTTGNMTNLAITQTDATSRTIYIDAVQLQSGSTVSAYQIGAIQLRGVIANPATFQSSSNSTNALQVNSASGTNIFNIDTLNSQVTVNTNLQATGNITQTSNANTNTFAAATTVNNLLTVSASNNTLSGNQYGINSALTVNPSGTSTGTAAGINGYVYASGVAMAGAGVLGFSGFTEYNASGGTLGYANGINIGGAVDAGNINSVTGLQITNLTGAGTVTNNTAININNQTKGTTSNYGLYIQGATTDAIYVASGATYLGGDVNTTGSYRTAGSIVINSSGVLQTASAVGTYGNITGVGTLTSGIWNATAVGANYGGTGQTSYAIGDLLYASSTTTLGKLSDVATGSCLISGGTSTAPTWGSCTGGNSYVNLQGATPGSAQTGNINVTGTIIGGAAVQSSVFDTATAANLTIGGTNATAVNIRPNTNSTAAVVMQRASGEALLTADTANNRLIVGDASAASVSTIAFVGQATNSASATTDTVTISTTSGDLLVASIGVNSTSAPGVSSVTDTAGNTWVRAGSIAAGAGTGARTDIWYAANATAVTSVTITVPSTTDIVANVSEYSGVSATSPLDTALTTTNLATTSHASSSLTTSSNGELVITDLSYLNGGTVTATGSGWTSLTGSSINTKNSKYSYQIAPSTGSFSQTWTSSTSTTSGSVIAAFRPASGNTSSLFVVDSSTSANAPGGVNGGIYYDTDLGKFRCYENGAYTNCIGGGAGSSINNGTTSQAANFNITGTSATLPTALIQANSGCTTNTCNILQLNGSTGIQIFGINGFGQAAFSSDAVLSNGTLRTSSGSTTVLTLQSGAYSGNGTSGQVLTTSAANTGAGASGAVTLQSGNTSGAGSSGAVNIKSGTSATGASGNIDIETGTAATTAGTIGIGATSTSALTLGNTAGTTTIEGSTVSIGVSTATHIINIGTGGTTTQTISIGSNSSSSRVVLQATTWSNVTNGIEIGAVGTQTNPTLLGLSNSSTTINSETAANCTTSVNAGALYYSTTTAAIRACVNGAFEDVVTTAGLGAILFGVVPDSGATPGDLFGIGTGNATGPCKVSEGANVNTVAWTACTAYTGVSNGTVSNIRKVLVNAGTAATSNGTTTSYQYLCLSNTTGQPVLGTSGGGAAMAGTGITTVFNPNAPQLCLARIDFAAANSNLTGIQDLRTYTTSTKQFVNVITNAPWLGGVVTTPSATAGEFTTTTTTGQILAGVVVSMGNNSTTAGTINALIATAGPGAVITNATAPIGSYLFSSAGSPRYTTGSTTASAAAYSNLGVALSSGAGNTCTVNSDTCHSSVNLMIDIH